MEEILRNDDTELTREDIMEMEKDPSEKGRINWEAWDRIVKNYREKYKEEDVNQGVDRHYKPRYVYNELGELIFQGNTDGVVEFVKPWITLSNAGVVAACCEERFRSGLFFSNHKYNQSELLKLKEKINFKRRKALFWKTRIQLTKTAIAMYSTDDEELMRFKDVNDALIWVRENISKKALKGRISKSLNEKCIAYGHFWRYLAEIDDVTSDEELEQDTK